MSINFKDFNDSELIEGYGSLLKELKKRKIIRSKNVVGDLGEYLTVEIYNKTPGLSNLQAAPTGTQNIDAISRKGDRYSIKSTTGKLTSAFYGLPPIDDSTLPEKKFEFVVIVKFSNDFVLQQINELTWDDFLKYKRWHKTMKAWNLPVTNTVLSNTKVVYKSDS